MGAGTGSGSGAEIGPWAEAVTQNSNPPINNKHVVAMCVLGCWTSDMGDFQFDDPTNTTRTETIESNPAVAIPAPFSILGLGRFVRNRLFQPQTRAFLVETVSAVGGSRKVKNSIADRFACQLADNRPDAARRCRLPLGYVPAS